MPRVVSLFLPRWPVQRFLAAQARAESGEPVDPRQPFVLCVDASNTPCIAGLNRAAEEAGLAKGERLADARAKAGFLQVRPADPAADDVALRNLAFWATRYTPAVSCFGEQSGADGLFLDVTGAAHLFGGEEALLSDLARRLERFGLQAKLAIADTAGAAWAVSRCDPSRSAIVPSGQEARALSDLPVEALRLSFDTRTTLRRLGFKRVGALFGVPRAPFAARFEKELLKRLDQALGLAAEPQDFIVAPPVYHSARYLLEPVFTTEAVLALAGRLLRDLMHALVRDEAGIRALRLSLYRVDGDASALDIGLAMPTRDIDHILRLIDLKLDSLADRLDVGFGFETIDLAVTAAEPLSPRQSALMATVQDTSSEACAALIDRLRERLGPHSVQRMAPVESHIPERAEAPVFDEGPAPAWPPHEDAELRPLVLLPKAERLESVTALVPDGPPRNFRWRGESYDVAHAQGPERIANEWWRDREVCPTRDYYLVEDGNGRRYWLYREGLFGRETASPGWFMHGLFA